MTRGSLVVLLLLVSVAGSAAQTTIGGTAGSAFRMGWGARSIGMGGAAASLKGPSGDGALLPSLLPHLSERTIAMGAASLSLDRSMYFLSYTTPLPPSAGLALTGMAARVGNVTGRDRNGIQTEEYGPGEYAAGLSFGLSPAPAVSFGVTARLLHARLIPEVASTTVGLDFSASYLVDEEFALSAAIRDVNSKYRWDTTPVYGRNGNTTIDRFPARTIVGASYTGLTVPLNAVLEAEATADLLLFRVGAEYAVHRMLTLRAGSDLLGPADRIGTRTAFGLSVHGTDLLWDPVVDYAYLLEPYAPSGAHIFTIQLHVTR